jgi:NAD(P)H dehydrogenase (quinone)
VSAVAGAWRAPAPQPMRARHGLRVLVAGVAPARPHFSRLGGLVRRMLRGARCPATGRITIVNVLTVYAHHNPRSFCHAILERFCAGLADAGHTNEVVDLHAIGFNPVLGDADSPNWIDGSVPDDVLAHMRVEAALDAAAGTYFRRLLLKRWIGGRDARAIVEKLHATGGPKDVAVQQAKVAKAQALVFVAPMYFVGFPAILKGWIERVFSLGFAFGLSPDGWRGDVGGRLPLLKHEKALILQTTIFDERSYEAGLKAAITVLVDEFALRFPGIKRVDHEYFYAVHGADDVKRAAYLDRAYRLGREF